MPTKLFPLLLFLIVGIVPAISQTTVIPNVPYGTDPAQVMDIYIPGGTYSQTAIILIHGGGGVGGDKRDLTGIANDLVGLGYVVANINYRLTTASSNRFPTAINDVHQATTWFQQNAVLYKLNCNTYAAFGTSAGAYLALTLGNTQSVQAVVDFYAPNDLTSSTLQADTFNGYSNALVLQVYLGYTYAQNPTIYATASPINYLSSSSPPTIIFHGTADTTVPIQQSFDLYQQLTNLDVVSQLNIEPGLTHGFLTAPGYNPGPVLAQVDAFLKANVP